MIRNNPDSPAGDVNTPFRLVDKDLTGRAFPPLVLPRQPPELLLLSLHPFLSPKLPALQPLMPRHPTPRAEQPMAPRALALRHLISTFVHHNLPALCVRAPHPLRGMNRRLRHRLLPPVENPGRNVGPQRVRLDRAAAPVGGAGDVDDVVAELVLDVLGYAEDAEGVAAAGEGEHVGSLLLFGADFACDLIRRGWRVLGEGERGV